MLEWTVAGVLSSDLATQHGVNEREVLPSHSFDVDDSD